MNEEIKEALELANEIMEYCQGDAWERECTEKDRSRFQEIYSKYIPKPKLTKDEQRYEDIKRQDVWCNVCNKMFYSKMGYKHHAKTSLKHKNKIEECAT